MRHSGKNILVTGAGGQLGTSLKFISKPEDACFFFTDLDLDITNLEAVDSFVQKNGIDVIINCAAYNNVDAAENEPEKANLLNAVAPAYLARVCKKYGAFLIHFSTDYVFGGKEGNTPWAEEDSPSPLGVYGTAKLKGEGNVAEVLDADKYLIIRTAWMFSEYGKNFVKTMLNLFASRDEVRVVADNFGTPTYAADLAQVVYDIALRIVNGKFSGAEGGLYNYTNEGQCSWYDFACQIKELYLEIGKGQAGKDGAFIARCRAIENCRIIPCTSAEYAAKARRPHYSVLDKSKIKKQFGLRIEDWKEALARCLQNMAGLR